MGIPGSRHRLESEFEPEIVAEINMTPLIDIFLVLLIIFMVTSSVMNQAGVGVDLPASQSSEALSQPEGVVVTLLSSGGVKINDQTIAHSEWSVLERELRKALKETSKRLVILEGDRQAFLGSAVEVMDTAKKAGAERFAIATQLKK